MKSPLDRIRTGALILGAVFVFSVVGFKWLGNETDTWLDAIWLFVITVSTVGYAESSASSDAIQVFQIVVIILGVTAAFYTCGGFLQLLFEGEVDRVLGKRKMTKEISALKDHVILCGFGRLGRDLVQLLQHRKLPFVVIDSEADCVKQARDDGIIAILGDATDESSLTEANVARARALVSALPTDAENVFITLTARNLNPDLQIIARAAHENSCRKLRQAGADKIVMPHRAGAQQMERMISRPSTADLVELFAEVTNVEMELDELQVSKESDLVGKSLAQSKIRNQFNVLVIGVKNTNGGFQFNPGPDHVICDQDTLLVMGDVNDINRMKKVHQI